MIHGRSVAARLRAGETLRGLLTKMPAPAVVELGGHAGFDLVVVDTEHGAAGPEALEHHIRAADSAGVEAVVRVGTPEPIETLRALDAGASGVIAPHVNDAARARSVVRAAHYPPAGERGLAVSTRAGRQGLTPVAEHVRLALESTLVIVQVEHAEALENVEEIAVEERVDAVFLGPNDLSLSLGHPGDTKHPKVAAAIDRVAEAVVGSGAALCVIANSEEEARSWEQRGARIVLYPAFALLGTRLKEVLSAPRTPAGAGQNAGENPDGTIRREA